VEPDRPQRDLPASCVIAQQYSSANFFSFIHARKNSARQYFKFPFLKKCVGLKSRKLGSVLFSSVTHSRTLSTYILPPGETPNFTPITHKWKNYSSVYVIVSVLNIKREEKDSEPINRKQSSNVTCSLLLRASSQ
jgi:hypothetical protein